MHRLTPVTRRHFVEIAMIAGLSAAAGAAEAAPCTSLGDADASLRESLHYAETGPNPAQTCSGCAFFSNAVESCGQCQIFNGPANVKGHCDSWSARG